MNINYKYWAISLCILIMVSSAHAQSTISNSPIAEWAKIMENIPESKPFIELQKQKAPTLGEVGVEPYPNSKLFMVDKYYCTDDTTFIGLVTNSNIEDVIKWYQDNLTNFGYFKYESRDIFLKDTKIFNPEKDASSLIEKNSVSIANLNDSFKKLLPQYKTYIEINFKPLNCKRR